MSDFEQDAEISQPQKQSSNRKPSDQKEIAKHNNLVNEPPKNKSAKEEVNGATQQTANNITNIINNNNINNFIIADPTKVPLQAANGFMQNLEPRV